MFKRITKSVPRPPRSPKKPRSKSRTLTFEQLEDRRVLTTISVSPITNPGGVGVGDGQTTEFFSSGSIIPNNANPTLTAQLLESSFESRVVLEFDLAGITLPAGEVIVSVHLDAFVDAAVSNVPDDSEVELTLFGYAADGDVTELDHSQINDAIGTDSVSTSTLGHYLIEIDAVEFVESFVGAGKFGMLLTVDNNQSIFAIRSTDATNTSERPLLIIETVVPATNSPPSVEDEEFSLNENSPNNTLIGMVQATDPGDTVTYSIIGGNIDNAFSIDEMSGELTVANSSALDFESISTFELVVRVEDSQGLSDTATCTIHLNDVQDHVALIDGVLTIEGGGANDKVKIFRWFDKLFVKSNFAPLVDFNVGEVKSISIDTNGGNDKVWISPWVHQPADINVGSGNDHVVSGSGDDRIFGESGNDHLDGGWGNDVIVGGADHDHINGGWGRDLLIGGLGMDDLKGAFGDDILIGGTTSYDTNLDALDAIMAEWTTDLSYEDRMSNISNGVGADMVALRTGAEATVFDDDAKDYLQGDRGRDWYFADLNDQVRDGGWAHDRRRSEHRESNGSKRWRDR